MIIIIIMTKTECLKKMFSQLLDSRDLTIRKVVEDSSGRELKFTVGEAGFVGSKIEIELPAEAADKGYESFTHFCSYF